MTSKQYNLLKFINSHDVHTEHCKQYNQITLYSLSHHDWIERKGMRVVCTSDGVNALEHAAVFERSSGTYNTEMTNRVQLMLRLLDMQLIKRA